MKALVVYESMFGNTAQVARAVGDALAERMDVEVLEVGDAPAPLLGLVDLVVVGGPTHAFSMTRPGTREDAVRRGAQPASATGIREWLARLQPGPHSKAVAAFDTRVVTVRHVPGSAAKAAVRRLRRLGYRPQLRPESFYVEDVLGPLLEGELDRAYAWASGLAEAVAEQWAAT
jgi:hypothetical protein